MSKCEWWNCENEGVIPCSNMDEIDSSTFYGGENEITVCQECHDKIESARKAMLDFVNQR